MFAKIGMTKSIRNTLRYHEEKIKNEKAELLSSNNFIKDSHQLNGSDKLDRFVQRISLNERVEKKVLHISLGFNKSEEISNEQMQVLARHYMTEMGFEKQPYLVYRHYDAAHPHCHIVSTNIRSDGRKINLATADFWKSRQITRNLEKQYNLSSYERISPEHPERYKVTQAQRVLHGQVGLKRAISDVLNTVVDHYSYTNLQELNAILHVYNVKANAGAENSYMHQHKGLVYHAIDERGRKVGKSIKASDFLLKPTLAKLEEKFVLNTSLRETHPLRVTGAINWTFAGTPPDWQGFVRDMEREGIDVVLLADKKGGPKDIFFVDHDRKAVFEGARLGPSYLLQALRERCSPERSREEQELEETQRQRLRLGL